jgi:hypothetical protein
MLRRPYRLGADGTDPDGAVDCIWLVYRVLEQLEIETPPFDLSWYEASSREVNRALLEWGKRLKKAPYNGDVALLPSQRWAFGVVWRAGLLHISEETEMVSWCALDRFDEPVRYFRSRKSCVEPLA